MGQWDFGVFLKFLRISLLLAWFYVVLGDLLCHWDIEALSSIHNGPFFPPICMKKYSVIAIKLKRREESRESHSSNVCSGCNAKCFISQWPWFNFHVRTDWTVLRQLCPLVRRLLQRRQSCSFTPASSFTMLCHCATSRGADSSKSHVANRGEKRRKVLSLQNLHFKPVMFNLILPNMGWYGQSQTHIVQYLMPLGDNENLISTPTSLQRKRARA